MQVLGLLSAERESGDVNAAPNRLVVANWLRVTHAVEGAADPADGLVEVAALLWNAVAVWPESADLQTAARQLEGGLQGPAEPLIRALAPEGTRPWLARVFEGFDALALVQLLSSSSSPTAGLARLVASAHEGPVTARALHGLLAQQRPRGRADGSLRADMPLEELCALLGCEPDDETDEGELGWQCLLADPRVARYLVSRPIELGSPLAPPIAA